MPSDTQSMGFLVAIYRSRMQAAGADPFAEKRIYLGTALILGFSEREVHLAMNGLYRKFIKPIGSFTVKTNKGNTVRLKWNNKKSKNETEK